MELPRHGEIIHLAVWNFGHTRVRQREDWRTDRGSDRYLYSPRYSTS